MPSLSGRRLLVLVLVPYAGWLVFAYEYHFLDGVNLAFHEAGHLFFAFFGQTLQMLGGTIFQLGVPVLCSLHFARRGRAFETALCGVWLGESVMNVARYMADAQAMVLPLVGGGIHDWNWLLGRLDLVHHCRTLGAVVHGLGSLIVVASLVASWRLGAEDEMDLLSFEEATALGVDAPWPPDRGAQGSSHPAAPPADEPRPGRS